MQSVCFVTIGVIGLVGAMLIFQILNEFEDVPETFFRLLAALTVFDLLGTLVTPMLKKITDRKVTESL